MSEGTDRDIMITLGFHYKYLDQLSMEITCHTIQTYCAQMFKKK